MLQNIRIVRTARTIQIKPCNLLPMLKPLRCQDTSWFGGLSFKSNFKEPANGRILRAGFQGRVFQKKLGTELLEGERANPQTFRSPKNARRFEKPAKQCFLSL